MTIFHPFHQNTGSLIWKLQCLEIGPLGVHMELAFKGHSQLLDRTDLDTSFLTLKKVHLNLKSKYI